MTMKYVRPNFCNLNKIEYFSKEEAKQNQTEAMQIMENNVPEKWVDLMHIPINLSCLKCSYINTDLYPQ